MKKTERVYRAGANCCARLWRRCFVSLGRAACPPSSRSGFTLTEVVIGLVVIGAAVVIYLRTVYPATKVNTNTRGYIERTSALASVLDSLVPLELEKLDDADEKVIPYNDSIDVAVSVDQLTAGEADAILPGMDPGKLRMVTCADDADSSIYLRALVSRPGRQRTVSCF